MNRMLTSGRVFGTWNTAIPALVLAMALFAPTATAT